jgi:molecular chaperone Hsp33
MPETLDSTEIPPSSDGTRRFLFEDADIRGEIVHLDSAYREIIAIHQYPLAVSRLLVAPTPLAERVMHAYL